MMTPERWSQIKEIFGAVMERVPEERQSALTEACRGDLELQAELRQLLAQHDEMGQFLDSASPVSASALLSPGHLLAGRYQVVSLLGTGGMGEVYEVEDQELGGRIALKVIHPQMSFDGSVLERFRREVQIARKITHPNVCRVFDIGHHQQPGREIIFLTMELVDGETLAARLKRLGKIPLGEALNIALQLCHALGAAHQMGVLHRDFKCGNVMLIGSGETVRAVVTDFGIARWMRTASDSTGAITTQGAIFGTPAYMSPEQIQGKELTVASDIYSLGLVLYEMVTGVRPFKDESPWAEALQRLTTNPANPRKFTSNLKPAWSGVILKCLAANPKDRFATVGEIAAALKGKGTASSIIREHPFWTIAAVLLILGVGIAFALRASLFFPSLPAAKHVAVLPFKFVGNDPPSNAIAYGLAQSLSENLSRLQATAGPTWVVPWSAIKEWSSNDEDHAGSSLGANLLITGELQRQNNRLHVAARLKDANTLRVLRSEVIDISESQVMSLENRLLERTAAMLELKLSTGMLQRLPVNETLVPGAYEFYEQGKGYLQRHTPEDIDQAITLFKTAIDKDPAFALALANLAIAYDSKFRASKEIRWLTQAQESADQAMSLNSNLISVHLAQGMVRQDVGDARGAIDELKLALQLDPANDEVRTQLSRAYEQAGQLLEAETLLKDTVKRNPAGWFTYNDLGAFYYRHGQYGQAEPLFLSAMELAPGNPKAFYNLGGLYAAQGKNKEAEAVLDRAIAIKPAAGAYSNLGTVLRAEGRYAESVQMLQKAVELSPGDDRYWSNLGNAYSLMGNEAKAMEAYRKSVEVLKANLVLRPKNAQLLQTLALNYANLHEKKQAMLTLDRISGPAATEPNTLFGSAMVYELIGERERALATLQAAVQRGLPTEKIRNAPTFDDLRNDSRYSRLMESRAFRKIGF